MKSTRPSLYGLLAFGPIVFALLAATVSFRVSVILLVSIGAVLLGGAIFALLERLRNGNRMDADAEYKDSHDIKLELPSDARTASRVH